MKSELTQLNDLIVSKISQTGTDETEQEILREWNLSCHAEIKFPFLAMSETTKKFIIETATKNGLDEIINEILASPQKSFFELA